MQPYDYYIAIAGVVIFLFSFYLDLPIKDYFEKSRKTQLGIFLSYVSSTRFIFFSGIALATAFYLYQPDIISGISGLIFLGFGTFTIMVVIYAIKAIIKRNRPAKPKAIIFTSYPDFSFPSAHSAFAFGAFALINTHFGLIQMVWLLFALLLAFGRIYLEEHYLSDVIAGMLIGYYVGLLLSYLNSIGALYWLTV